MLTIHAAVPFDVAGLVSALVSAAAYRAQQVDDRMAEFLGSLSLTQFPVPLKT